MRSPSCLADWTMRSQTLLVLSGVILLGGVAKVWAREDRSAATSALETASAATDHPLIKQLGDDDFMLRRDAEAKLLALGTEAFDLLEDAQSHPDLEIATEAQYLIYQVPVLWVRADDPEDVRDLMTNYQSANEVVRLELVEQLSAIENSEGTGALSRIAHFELSTKLAKHAALSVLAARREHQHSAASIAEQIAREIGSSHRESVRWLRLYCAQLQAPGEVLSKWLPLIDEETRHLSEAPASTSQDIVERLLQFHTELSEESKSPTQLFESLRRRIELLTEERGDQRFALAQTILDVFENEQWEALKLLEDYYAQAIDHDRLLLYLVAVARAKHQMPAEAAAIAYRAFLLDASDLAERTGIADQLSEWGHHDWAEREWRYVSETAELTSVESMEARRALANWCLHDRLEDKQAADLLAEVCDAVDAQPELKNKMLRKNDARYLLTELRKGREFFTACHLEQQGDVAGQRKHLELAYTHQTGLQDPDILIAMYRVQDGDEAYHRKVVGRIDRAARQVDELIQRAPEEAMLYNHWAWLISNTEGDFDKAVRYSLRSLELSPGSASYLDTLGRCYYAKGDLENAVTSQRLAVAKQPHVQVMQRQLKLFESELAAHQSQAPR